MSFETVLLGDHCDLQTGGTPRRSEPANFEGGQIPWLVSGDIHQSFISSCEGRITQKGYDGSSAKFLPVGSIMIALNGQGKTRGTVAQLGFKATCNQSLVSINSRNQDQLSNTYLYWNLKSRYDEIRKMTGVSGNDRRGLNMPLLRSIKIPLPSLPEQKRIAAILDQADALRQKRQQALDHLNQLGQSIFYEMFLDGGNYKKRALIDCVEGIQIGPFGSLLHQADYIENGIPLINPKHINGGKIEPQTKVTVTKNKYEELQRYHMRSGDVVMARRGEMGRCAVVDEQADGYLCGTGSLFIRSNLDVLRPFFLQRFLSSPRTIQILENEASGVTMLNLNAKALKALPIPIPPIAKQIEFEEKVSERSGLSKSMELNHQKLEDLFASLQQRAFRGEL